MSGLLDLSSSINALQQAASAQTTDTSAPPLINPPPLAPMPAPKPAPDVPTDDHGQSNIVFSNADADGALIH
jgi:hypothetical protein